jgi:hypothetical protein
VIARRLAAWLAACSLVTGCTAPLILVEPLDDDEPGTFDTRPLFDGGTDGDHAADDAAADAPDRSDGHVELHLEGGALADGPSSRDGGR